MRVAPYLTNINTPVHHSGHTLPLCASMHILLTIHYGINYKYKHGSLSNSNLFLTVILEACSDFIKEYI